MSETVPSDSARCGNIAVTVAYQFDSLMRPLKPAPGDGYDLAQNV